MRAALSVAGVELGISTQPGHLEHIVLRTCSAHLGAPSGSACSVVLSSLEGPIGPARGVAATITAGRARLRGDAFGDIDLVNGGTVTVRPQGESVRAALRLVVNALAPASGVLVVRGSASMTAGSATVTVGDAVPRADTAPLAAGYVAIAARSGGWTVCSTPFDDASVAAVARHAMLGTCRVDGDGRPTTSILEQLAGPLDADGRRRAEMLVSRLLPWVSPRVEAVTLDV